MLVIICRDSFLNHSLLVTVVRFLWHSVTESRGCRVMLQGIWSVANNRKWFLPNHLKYIFLHTYHAQILCFMLPLWNFGDRKFLCTSSFVRMNCIKYMGIYFSFMMCMGIMLWNIMYVIYKKSVLSRKISGIKITYFTGRQASATRMLYGFVHNNSWNINCL
jgi:hypothetical protein